jgi:hypothetical protein
MTVELYAAVYFAFANPSTSGDNQVVAAVSGKRIRVISYSLANGAATANSVKFRSAANDKTSLKTLPANTTPAFITYAGGVSSPAFDCNAGEPLQINLSAATAVGCDVTYQLL